MFKKHAHMYSKRSYAGLIHCAQNQENHSFLCVY